MESQCRVLSRHVANLMSLLYDKYLIIVDTLTDYSVNKMCNKIVPLKSYILGSLYSKTVTQKPFIE